MRQVDAQHNDGLANLRSAVQAEVEQVIVLVEPDGGGT